MNRLIALIMVSFVLFFWQVSYGGSVETPSKSNQQFIDKLVPIIQETNMSLTRQRARLQKCHNQFQWHNKVTFFERAWLNRLAISYGVTPDFSEQKTWTTLLDRIDTLPASLVLAQAINESDWGRSRFAREGNNYFGQWCYDQGCGMVPAKRSPGKIYEVRVFKDPTDSVKSYYKNINTHLAYQPLRHLRSEQRARHHALNSLDLAKGLTQYSQRKDAYIKSIQNLIKHFNLQQYDIG